MNLDLLKNQEFKLNSKHGISTWTDTVKKVFVKYEYHIKELVRL